MLSLGDADSILVTQWKQSCPVRILIDGGNRGSFNTVNDFLLRRSIKHIDHIVCTHPHNDHAAGLAEVLNCGKFSVGAMWMHIPQRHVNMQLVESALRRAGGLKRVQIIQESLATVTELFSACSRMSIPVFEPFAGIQIGPLKVIGPSINYYESLVHHFSDVQAIVNSESLVSNTSTLAAQFLAALGQSNEGSLLANPKTQAENDSSVILATTYGSDVYLFTGDAGVEALTRAASMYQIGKCHWMQIPHHGSRRNINEALIQRFAPTCAFVSAKGNLKHPRRAVVNAFKRVGSKVYSTHYPTPLPLYHSRGNVPAWSGLTTAASLYETHP